MPCCRAAGTVVGSRRGKHVVGGKRGGGHVVGGIDEDAPGALSAMPMAQRGASIQNMYLCIHTYIDI